MQKIFVLILVLFSLVLAGRSVIVEAEGISAMGDDKSKKETIIAAKKDAKRNASENAETYIKSETAVKNYMTERDLMEAYSQAIVKVLEVVSGEWYEDKNLGTSYRIKIRAEVSPQTEKIKKLAENSNILDDPTAPLNLKVWADKKDCKYQAGEKMKIYLRGNKPFLC